MTHSRGCTGIEMMSITKVVRRFTDYKYHIRLVLMVISHSFFFSLRVSPFLFLRLRKIEEKRGTKCPRSPSKEVSLAPSSAPTPSLPPSGLSPPLGSPPEVSSRCPRSPVFEQGGSSERNSMVDLSSEDEDILPYTS
jgi:hypothetical protein